MNSNRILKLVLAAICLALCMVLPFLTGQIPEIGSMLSPMHIPVLLCGFICGPLYAAAVGVVAPVLRFALFGMPPLFPVGAAMCFELLTYGLVSSLLYRALPKKKSSIYVALVGAMLAGRVISGIVKALILTPGLSFTAWATASFVTALPGISVQLIMLPTLVVALNRAGLVPLRYAAQPMR